MQGIMDKGAAPAPEQEPDERSGNEAFDAGLQVVRQALYEQGGAKDIAKVLASGDNPAQSIAEQAYKIVEIADERTMGEIPDELLVDFAIEVLTEVSEVAEAAGVKVDGNVVSEAFSTMLERFLAEQGMDTTQIKQAMAQMNQGGQAGAVLDEAAEQEM
jgi:hypothetical protein